jgi:Ala-tRNA(Pro) deacylase
MMRRETLNFHPLVNTMTTAISREDLLRFLKAMGHDPRVLVVSGPEPPGAAG